MGGTPTVLTPPPDPGNAVPDVQKSTGDKIGGFLGAISNGGALGSISDALGRAHQKRLTEAKMYHDAMVEKLSHPAFSDPNDPDHDRIQQEYSLVKDNYLKALGDKDAKANAQQRIAIAEHHVASQGGGQNGAVPPPPSPTGSPSQSSSSPAQSSPMQGPPAPAAPAATPDAAAGNGNPAVPPPPKPDATDVMAGVPAERAQLQQRAALKQKQAESDIEQKRQIAVAQAKPPATEFSAWQDAFKSEHGRVPTTTEIDVHLAEKGAGKSAATKPLGTERAQNLNQTLTALNGGKDLPPYMMLGPDATQKDYDNAKSAIDDMRKAAAKPKDADISDDAVNAFADVVMKGGALPNLGLGGANARIKIINRVGQIAAGKGKPSTGTGDQIVSGKAALTALTRELTGLQVQRGAVGAFENTALKNLELFEKTAEAVVDKGSPWVNKPLREVEAGGLGSDEVVAYNTARNVALTEISRVLANPNMTGVLSDQQRGEVGALIGPGATLSNVLAASKILKQDMKNRKDSLDDELDAVHTQIGTKPGKNTGGEAWTAPKDAPPAPKQDGHKLKSGDKVIAVSKGGAWANPSTQ